MLDSIGNFFKGIWNSIVDAYIAYDNFIHSFAPGMAGDLIVAIINVGLVFLIIKSISFGAFKRGGK